MKKKAVSILLAVTLVTTTLTACGAKDEDASTSGDTIKIGVVAPLTGGYALYGASGKNSVELAIEEINATGGVLGKQLEISEYVDDKGDSTEAVNAYNRLNGQDIVAVVGSFSSSCSIPMAEIAKEEGMLLLSPTATNAKLTLVGPSIFRACFIDPVQGPMMAKFAQEEGYTKAAMIYAKDDDYSNGLKEAIDGAWSGFGLEMVYTGECTTKDVDYTAQVSQVVASGADVLFYPAFLDTVPILVQQAREAGFEGAIVGGDGWDGSNTSGIEAYFDNTFYTNHYAPEDPAEAVQKYVTSYKDKYGAESLTSVGACYYDAIYMLKDAIEASETGKTADIITAMTGMSFSGVTGSFTLDENGDPAKPITFVEFKEGKPVWKSNVQP